MAQKENNMSSALEGLSNLVRALEQHKKKPEQNSESNNVEEAVHLLFRPNRQEKNEHADRNTLSRRLPSSTKRPFTNTNSNTSKRRKSATFMKDLVLIPSPKIKVIPKGELKEHLQSSGFIVNAFEVLLEAQEEEIRETIFEKFQDKLPSKNQFSFMKPVHKKLMNPSGINNINGKVLKHLSSPGINGCIYIRSLIDITKSYFSAFINCYEEEEKVESDSDDGLLETPAFGLIKDVNNYTSTGQIESSSQSSSKDLVLEQSEKKLGCSTEFVMKNLVDIRTIHAATGNKQKISINRSDTYLKTTLIQHKRGQIDISYFPEVTFENGEEGMDADGPKREYFYILLDRLIRGEGSIQLFEGDINHKVPVHNEYHLDSELYLYAGKVIAHSILHNGGPVIGLSPAYVHFLITNDIAEAYSVVTDQDFPDFELRHIIQQIRSCDDDKEMFAYQSNDFLQCELKAAGFGHSMLTTKTKDTALYLLTIYCIFKMRHEETEQLREGFETISLISVLKNNRSIWKDVFQSTSDVVIQAEDLYNQFKLPKAIKEAEEKALVFFKDYVMSLANGNEDTVDEAITTKDLLVFCCSSPVPLENGVTLKFNRRGKPLPDADTCLSILSIPICHDAYNDFKKAIDATLRLQGQGFGRL